MESAGTHETGASAPARPWLRVLRVVGLLGLLAFSLHLLMGGGPPLEPGAPAPPVRGLRRLDGSLGSLALAQGRPLVVNIWATWCPACVQELPMLAAAARAHGDAVGFYGLAIDSSRSQMKQLIERMGVGYDMSEIDGATAHAWNATALPSTYILDGQGRIHWSVRGAIDRSTLEEHLAPLLP